MYRRALALAEYAGFAELIHRSDELTGYFVDLPEEPLVSPNPRRPVHISYTIWWWLALSSHQMAYWPFLLEEATSLRKPWRDGPYLTRARETLEQYPNDGPARTKMMFQAAMDAVPLALPDSPVAVYHGALYPLTLSSDGELIELFSAFMQAHRAAWHGWMSREVADLERDPTIAELEA